MNAYALKLENRLDRFLERVENFQDYLFNKALTWTELFFFWLALGVALWFALFDVKTSSTIYKYLWSELAWCAGLTWCAGMHLGGIFWNKLVLRRIAAHGYVVAWSVWTVTGGLSNYQSLVIPVFAPITFLAIVHAARLNARL
jgi:hypothetical protein